MPYVDHVTRKVLDTRLPETPGELNYVITTIVDNFLMGCGRRYDTYNAVVGVLECAKLELYRRMIAPYEDKKCRENGDVYPNLEEN